MGKKRVLILAGMLCLAFGTKAEDSIAIVQKADFYMESPIPVITQKARTFSSNKHNYESLATYLWENPNDPDAPWIARDGEKNPERLKYDGDKINQFSIHCRYFSSAYLLTKDKKYRKRYNQEVRHWFTRLSTRMYPNMEYAQINVNRDNNRGQYYGIIDGYVLIDVIHTLNVMRQNKATSTTTYRQVQHWFRDFSQWLQTSENGIKQGDAPNNLSVAYDVMLCEFLAFAGDSAAVKAIGEDFIERRLYKQIAADGSQPQELKRAKPMSYSLYNLKHIYDFCAFQKPFGLNIYADHKEYIDNAIRYIDQILSQPEKVKSTEKNEIAQDKNQLKKIKKDFESLL